MKPCIHSAGKRTLHPNSTLLCHVHFLSSVLSCGVFTFKVFLVISEPENKYNGIQPAVKARSKTKRGTE